MAETEHKGADMATHLLDWLPSGYDHCQYGSRDWCEGYLNNAASVLTSQASQIEALRKERDEARLCQQQIAAGSNQSATVARIIIAKNEADGRAEAAETKLAEAINKLRENGIDFDPETA